MLSHNTRAGQQNWLYPQTANGNLPDNEERRLADKNFKTLIDRGPILGEAYITLITT